MCDCVTTVNELMVKKRQVRLRTTTNFNTGISKVYISTEPIPGTKKQKFNLLPSFCPFCGEKYPN